MNENDFLDHENDFDTTPVEEEHIEVEQQKESSKEMNFRLLREKAERLERERDEAVRTREEMAAYYTKALKPEPVAEVQSDEDDDDFVDRRSVKKMLNDQKREYEERLHNYERQTTNDRAEREILSNYPDYRSIVNDTTIKKLMTDDPELAASIASNPNFKTKAIATYNAIKKIGYHNTEEPDSYTTSQKPRSSASINAQGGGNPLMRSNPFAEGLTPELSKALLKEMKEARKRF